MAGLADFFAHVDANQERWIEKLRVAVAIDSVSSDPARRGRCFEMMEAAQRDIIALGGTAELHPIGDEKPGLPLPPILLGQIGNDASKKTIAVYGHLDVQPAEKADGWATEPFELTIRDGKMYGRGSTDDKGPVLSWLHAIESFQALGKPIPCNVKFILEGMEESGSIGLKEFIDGNKAWFHDVDAICISDNYWLGPRKPCLTYGLRGLAYFEVEVTCASKDLHSGVYGGPVHEAMIDLVKVLGSLQADDGRIAIAGINDAVRPMTPEEEATYAGLDFNPAEFAAECGAAALRHGDKKGALTARWRYPSLSIHGIEGAWSGAGAKTVIPRSVIGKFSIRLVPDMAPDAVQALVEAHVQRVFADLATPNTLAVRMLSGAKAWLSDFGDFNYSAARRAIETVFGEAPDLTREGGSIPVTLWLQEATGKSVMLLPIGACDDSAHSQNEKLNISNYMNGIKVLGAYLHEVAQ